MVRELIDKLKSKRQQLQKYKTNNDAIETKESKEIDIKISKQDNIYKIEIDEQTKSVISNLENIKGIETILNMELLKEHVLNNLTSTKRNL